MQTLLLDVESNQQYALAGLEPNTQGNGSRFLRSRQMIGALRQEFLYSEKRARDILFREIEAISQFRSPITVAKLTREAAARGRERARQVGYDFSNWDNASKATINAELGAGVLLSQFGRPIPLSIAAPATEVTALAEQFQDRTEAHLLEVVIRKLGDVTTRDHKALAHALFRQFDPRVSIDDLEDRVATLLASLVGRVALAEGGTYFPLGYSS
jgi:hypothetical protein